MNWKQEAKPLTLVLAGFLLCYYLPLGADRFDTAILEALHLVRWYAREHVLLCLVPAFFIAGAIGVFVSQASVMKYLGGRANKVLAYSVASVSGSVLAVCSCTVLPLFAGIYKMGAGLGPATAFLYAGPAINVMAIILTSRVLGMELGIARAAGAVLFSIVIGLLMNFFFRHEEAEKNAARMHMPEPETNRPLWQNSICFAVMVFILIFANLGTPEIQTGLWPAICTSKWLITGLFSICFAVILVFWFKITWWKIMVAAALTSFAALLFSSTPLIGFTLGAACLAVITATDTEESQHWCEAAWGFAKQIIPLLFYGVLIAGLLLGRPGHEGLIPPAWINALVGGNSVSANLFASVVGAFMYFATLTEVPILEGLIGSGMGKGPALALLLAGPALSLPNMLVIRSVIGTAKTIVFVCLVVCMAALSGFLYGLLF